MKTVETSSICISLWNGKHAIVSIEAGIHDLLAFELVDARSHLGDLGAETVEYGGIDSHEGTCGDAEQE